MIPLLVVAVGVFGAIVGSFLNVCIYRYGTGVSFAKGRSHCPCCGKILRTKELVPIFSFLFQKGRCVGCGSKISWQYPIVELFSAILFVLVFLRQYALYPLYTMYPHGVTYLVSLTAFYWVTLSLLLVIAAYDMRHKIIPNGLVYAFGTLSVIKLLTFAFLFKGPLSILDLLAPIILFIPFWFLWKVSGGTWIGLGDGKLAFGIGALLGLSFGISALILGFWIGAALCILLMIIEKLAPGLLKHLGLPNIRRGSEIPLGPFLIIGTIIVLFCRVDVLGLSQLLVIG